MGSHCEQVRVMERLRQEVLLLHGKLQSQEEIIDTLNREVKESRNQKEILEIEFKTYRLKMQEKITTLMEERANGWLGNLELSNDIIMYNNSNTMK
jgi:tRNA(Ser,Leu) C12 N-acetylase TAN1